MRTILVLLALAGVAEAQTITGERFQLNTGPCTMRSGSGVPSTSLGAVCDTYYRTDSPYTVYVKTGASTWTMMVAVDGVATGQVLASNGSLVQPVYTATPSLTGITGAANLTINPTGDVIFNPTGNDLLPTTGYDLNIGALTNKYLTIHAAELWVETLVAQDTIATIGGRVLVGPTTTLTADLTSGASTMQVKHNQIVSGDRVLLQANGLVEWIATSSGPSGSAGAYTYSITRDLDGSGANNWTAGDAVFNTGLTGDGFIDLYSISAVTPARFQYIYNFNTTGSAYSSNYAEVLTWEIFGDGANNAVNDATYFGANATFLTITQEANVACAAGGVVWTWEYWNGSAWTSFVPSGGLCAAGHNAMSWSSLSGWATTTVNSNSAYWIRARITTAASPATSTFVTTTSHDAQQWGPTIVGNVRTSGGFNNIEPRWAIGNLNGLYGYSSDTYGTAFGSPSAAWIKIDPTNGVRLGYSSTTSAQITAAGAASFVTGNITLDTAGIRIAPDTAVLEPIDLGNSYGFSVTGTNAVMGIYGSDEATGQNLVIENYAESGDAAIIQISTAADGVGSASINMSAAGTIQFSSAGTSAYSFYGPSGGADLTIFGDNGSTTSNPYMRSDGNALWIETRSTANGGNLQLNSDKVADTYISLGGGTTYLYQTTFQTRPNWASGLSQSTVGAAGGASALPATPVGYLKVNYNGTAYVIPAYNP